MRAGARFAGASAGAFAALSWFRPVARSNRDPDPLARHRDRWDIDTRRDGINLWSALRRPTPASLIYVVSHSPDELAARLDAIDAAQETEQ